ncbi:MAG TPA: hypothetical protein VM733_06950, partial [Thermoanaerobaculia bacterium]|nr:hypothetical protein [Thermoanaerobaculia bacterium]
VSKTRFASSVAASRIAKRNSGMKKKTEASEDPLDREIDFSNARPNPYARDYYKSRNLRVLAPDLLEVFPDSESVNEALRTLVRLTQRTKVSARRVAAPRTKKSS